MSPLGRIMKNVLERVGSCFLILVIGTIAICILTVVLSMSVETVTGFDLIRQVIRPMFGH